MDRKASAGIQPTIIKRKKVVKADGHHGGAWKVAYADFVTAMMAFFLLMWLLNATTEDQRKGISDYFNPSVPISRISGGGSDGLNGSSIFTEDTLAQMGTGASRDTSVNAPPVDAEDSQSKQDQSNGAAEQAIADNLENLKQALSEDGKALSEHLMIRMSPEGIVLEITDSDSSPLFRTGSSEPSNMLADLVDAVSSSFGAFENDIKIVGHTDGRRFRNRAVYDNWNLSADRANTARRLLLRAGLDPSRIAEVSGKADTEPLVAEDAYAPQNRRISITILKR